MDNVLTQAAVNMVAIISRRIGKNILKNLNIYEAGLKTGLIFKNVSEKSYGKIQPEDLNRIAADILADIDTSMQS